MKTHSFILGAMLACAASTGFAQWQWLDKDGRKVFSDRAPTPDVPEKNILKRPNGAAVPSPGKDAQPEAKDAAATLPLTPAGRSAPSDLEKEVEAKKKQAADAAAAKQKAAEQAAMKSRIENCARAKQAKATMDSGIRIARTNAAGEKEILDDVGRAAETKRIQDLINSECR